MNLTALEMFEIEAENGEWHVYEVTPIGKVYAGEWDDLICDSAEIIKYIGNAKGLLENKKKKFKAGEWKSRPGSSVNLREVKAKVLGRGEWGGHNLIRPHNW
jgi:hypothetical protein